MQHAHHNPVRPLAAAAALLLLSALPLLDCRAEGDGAQAAATVIDRDDYAISSALETKPAVQAESSLLVTVTPKGGYKINTAFPFKTTVTCDENIVPKKTKLTKADAAEFSKERIVLRVPFTPQKKGSFVMKLKAELGVCKAEKCKIVKETWDAAVTVP